MEWLSRPKYRKRIFQVVTAILVIAVITFFISNTIANLNRLHQDIHFGFLKDRAGFAISQSLVPYTQDDSYLHVFFVGLLNTLLISILAAVGATILGVLLGVGRLSKNWLLSKIIGAYIDLFRNIPLLLQIFFWYFAVLSVLPSPRASTLTLDCNADKACFVALSNRGLYLAAPHWDSLLIGTLWTAAAAIAISISIHLWNRHRQRNTGKFMHLSWLYVLLIIVVPTILYLSLTNPDHYSLPTLQGFNYHGGITILPELAALWLALTLYSAAYIAEYVRAGIQSVSKGQFEAAASLGLSPNRIMQLVILPQALRVIIPPITNQYLNVVKNSSLATAIAYPDLVSVFTGTTLNQTGRAIEIISITMAVYLTISLAIALGMNLYNHRTAIKER